ncbi:MAG: CotH kinase family protein, partial [Planctomycetales bacterium]|nr:CotH kinase family protein [Planctomycetales bacterium]
MEFYFTVTDQDGNTSIDPALETDAADRTANYLYQVIDDAPNTQTWHANDQPIHYLIMRDAERLLLADIGDGPLAQAESNAQMNGTLIRIDGNGADVRYLTGIRNRGGSSRIGPPNNYRINVPHDRPLDDAVSLNFNSRFTHAQVIGSAIFRLAGLTAAEAAPIQVRLNNLNLAEPDGPLMFGSYVNMEVVNGSFPDNHYPDDRRGNFYRAFAFGTKNASLEYLGPDAAPYAESYEKITNEEDNDWSDIIQLTQVLTETPDADFVAELEQTIHVDQWLRYLALDSLLGNLETGLNLGTGDNFWLYRGTVDSRFEIIPHDLDTILGRARVGEPNRSIFTYTNVPGLRRLLTHPDLVPRYYQAFLDLMDEVYNPETLHPLLDQLLGDWVPADELHEMKQFIVDRTAGVLAQIPQEFTITSQLDEVNGIARSTQPAIDVIGTANAVTTRSVTVNGQLAEWSPFSREWSVRTSSQGETTTLIPFGSNWRFLDDGSNQGTRWRRRDFDDVPWRTGIAPLGYGEGNEATVVSFGSNSADKYVTTYFRQTFDVADVDQVRDLTLRLRRDDGAVVYLNGQEVVRSNMPIGDIDFQTVASSWIGGGLEGQTLSYSIDPNLLLENDNILAVEIHQRSPIDDDLRFDLELEAAVGQIQGGVALLPGLNRITVEAFDGVNGTGNIVDVDSIDVWYDGAIGKNSATCNSYQQFGSLLTQSQLSNVTLTEDAVLGACGAAYRISGQLNVPAGVTLTIMPGTTLFFEEDAGLTVNGGRLVAEGTAYETIRFTRSPSSVGSWQGIQFVETMQDNRLRHAIVEHGVTEEGMVGLRSSQLLIESTTFDHTDRFRIRTVDSSLVIRNSRFEDIFAADQPPTTDNRSEHIWGSGIADDGQLLIDGNYFGTTKGHNDAMDFDGAERPGPIPVIINNFFAGTGDDALDLETDAHIEGNVFRNVRKDEFNSSTGDANAISAGNGRHYVVVRNTFENVDHAVQVKDDAFLTFDHNTVVGVPVSAIYFDLPDRSPGKGAIITDSIFADTVATFSAADQAEIVEVHRSIVMPDAVAYGSDNLVADARFVAPQNHDFRLRPSSPAVNFGDSGLDLGSAVRTGAVIGSRRPELETTSHSSAFQIFGAGMEAYRYQLNDQPLSEIRRMDEPIELSNLANGTQRLRVIGRDSAGRWQTLADADEYVWNINDQLPPIRINEVLASNDSAFSASET